MELRISLSWNGLISGINPSILRLLCSVKARWNPNKIHTTCAAGCARGLPSRASTMSDPHAPTSWNGTVPEAMRAIVPFFETEAVRYDAIYDDRCDVKNKVRIAC